MMANPTNHSIHSEVLPDFTNRSFNFAPPYRSDQPHPFRSFGDVLIDVPFLRYNRHSKPIISALFVAANPRNDPMLGKTFLTVEKKVNGNWEIVRTDNDYDTRYIYIYIHLALSFFLFNFFIRFYWQYRYPLLGMSEALIEWHVDSSVEPGTYRLGYFGNNRTPFRK